jgi:hypothetical protein
VICQITTSGVVEKMTPRIFSAVQEGNAQCKQSPVYTGCCFVPVHSTLASVLNVLQMTQRPEWRKKAAESGVLHPLIHLIEPSILLIQPFPNQEATPFQQSLMGYNMLVQVLLAINWCGPKYVSPFPVAVAPLQIVLPSLNPPAKLGPSLPSIHKSGLWVHSSARSSCRIMFDDTGEEILHSTDLLPRLTAALDGPNAWIGWDIPRSIARNIIHKLKNPPQQTPLVYGKWRILRDLQNDLQAYSRPRADLPERRARSQYQDGTRLEDPTVLFTSYRPLLLRAARVWGYCAHGTTCPKALLLLLQG